LDGLEHSNIFFIFWLFWAVRHILRGNCAKISTDKPQKAAYEIFSIERRFRRSKSWHGVS